MISWDKVRWFEPWEFDDPLHPGSGKELNGVLLFVLERLRERTHWPIVVHRDSGGGVDVEGSWGHAANSFHLLENGAKAADFHFDTAASPRLQYFQVALCGFGGLGIYYDWGITIGFHVDVRAHTLTQRWVRRDGKYFYLLD